MHVSVALGCHRSVSIDDFVSVAQCEDSRRDFNLSIVITTFIELFFRNVIDTTRHQHVVRFTCNVTMHCIVRSVVHATLSFTMNVARRCTIALVHVYQRNEHSFIMHRTHCARDCRRMYTTCSVHHLRTPALTTRVHLHAHTDIRVHSIRIVCAYCPYAGGGSCAHLRRFEMTRWPVGISNGLHEAVAATGRGLVAASRDARMFHVDSCLRPCLRPCLRH